MALIALATSARASDCPGPDEAAEFDIPQAPLTESLQLFALQSNVSYWISTAPRLDVIQAPQLQGSYSPHVALKKLLAGTGVAYRFVSPCLVELDSTPRLRTRAHEMPPDRIGEVHILASRRLNSDVPKAEDGARSHIVLNRREIERSAAMSLADLLRGEVPGIASNSRTRPDLFSGLTEQIDLLGLGASHTLVLIDGRRMAGRSLGGNPLQPDLTAIPLLAIERIEVLRGNGSAAYGLGASGGVLNVVLRHDCDGTRAQLGYGGSLSDDSGFRRAFLASCAQWDRTQLQFSGAYSEEPALLASDRAFLSSGRKSVGQYNSMFFPNVRAPPLGAQPNIRTFDGSGLRGAGTPAFASVSPEHTSADGTGQVWWNPGRYNLRPADSAQMDGGRRSALLSGPVTRYASSSLTHEFSPSLRGFADGSVSESAASTPVSGADYAGLFGIFVPRYAPTNPFGKDLLVTVPLPGADGTLESRLRSRWWVAGLTLVASDSWTWSAEYSRSDSRLDWQRPMLEGVQQAIWSGELDVFRDLEREPLDLSPYLQTRRVTPLVSTTQAVSLRMAGRPLMGFALPVQVSALLEHRDDHFSGGSELADDESFVTLISALNAEARTVDSAFAQIQLPLLGSDTPASKPRLSLEFSARIDAYSSESVPPTREPGSSSSIASRTRAHYGGLTTFAGMTYQPWPGLTFRSGVGDGFLPPTASQLAAPTTQTLPFGAFLDARRGREPTQPLEVIAGGNPDLAVERSSSWSAGMVLRSAKVMATLDYMRTLKTDGILNPADVALADLARFEDIYPSRVHRSAGTDENIFGRILAIDVTNINSSRAELAAWDMSIRYEDFVSGLGLVTASARATWQPALRLATSPMSPVENQVGITAEWPLKFAAMSSLYVTRGNCMVGWSTRYLNPYRVSNDPVVLLNQGSSNVPRQIYHDVVVRYAPKFAPVDIQLNVKNVFNRRPPFDAAASDYISAFGDPRMATYGLSITARF